MTNGMSINHAVASGEQPERPKYPINSVDNALRLLLAFRDQRLIRVGEAGELLGVVASTAHRLMAMLEYHGFVQQDADTKAYRAGPSLIDIGLSVVRQTDLRQHLRPYLERLTAASGETSHLIILRGANSLFIDSVESHAALRTSSRIGMTFPAHTVSGGKALLAALSADQLAELYPVEELAGLTARSITTRTALLKELEMVRQRGYATNQGESETDIAAVAVLVRNAFEQPRAAIAVSAPRARIDERTMRELATQMSRLAGEAAGHII